MATCGTTFFLGVLLGVGFWLGWHTAAMQSFVRRTHEKFDNLRTEKHVELEEPGVLRKEIEQPEAELDDFDYIGGV